MLEKESQRQNIMDQAELTLKAGLTAFMTLDLPMVVLHTNLLWPDMHQPQSKHTYFLKHTGSVLQLQS